MNNEYLVATAANMITQLSAMIAGQLDDVIPLQEIRRNDNRLELFESYMVTIRAELESERKKWSKTKKTVAQ